DGGRRVGHRREPAPARLPSQHARVLPPLRESEARTMLRINGTAQRLCDGVSRRDFIRVGSLGALGLSWPALLRANPPANADSSFGRAKRCVLLFLTGGPPQHDTWDLKPDAPAEIRGELKPIATTVPGIRISELFPQLAQQANRLCIVRSVTHHDTVHTS